MTYLRRTYWESCVAVVASTVFSLGLLLCSCHKNDGFKNLSGSMEVTPNPCQAGDPYDVYYRLTNSGSESVTATSIVDGGDPNGVSVVVGPGSTETVHSAHGDHAVAGTYVHNAIINTTKGTVHCSEYTFVVQTGGGGSAEGWMEVDPNPCNEGDPYDVYYKVNNGTSSSITVTKVSDDGSTVWTGSTSVPAQSQLTVYSAHGDHAQAGTYVHHPVFYTSAGTIYGPEYTFVVRP